MFDIKGMDALMADIGDVKVAKVLKDVDREIYEQAVGLAEEMANRAPILTGDLHNSLISNARHSGFLEAEVPVDLDNVPYTWRQNYEHKTRRYFITTPANKMEVTFPKEIQKVVDNAW